MSLRNKILILFVFCSLQSFESIFPQPFIRSLNGIPVYDSSGRLPNTFSGGHNNIEPQFIDIDDDGDYDLIYLDSDGTYGWYKNIGDKFNPQFILSFDTIPGMKFSDWFYFIDIDDDGDYDLFTGGAAAFIEFRRNTGSSTSPFFTLEIDTVLDSNGDFIFSEFGCNPVFIDIDNDGDYDFLTGNSIGTITFYENIGNNQNFNFEFITNFWQDILIIGGGLRNNQLNPELHGASSLDFPDIDGDGDFDLFWGDFFGRSLYFLENQGTGSEPNMELIYNSYPPNQDSVWTSGFNMPRFVDIDGDSDLDMFISVLYDARVPQSLMFYRNIGTLNNPNFIRITEDYLKTLDAGIQSAPYFVDIDNDGDLDLFIGSTKSPNGTIHYFENIGDADNPSFLLVDSAYFNISADLTVSPAFGDLDGDGDYDLLVGEFIGRISYYENTGDKFTPNFVFRAQLKDSSGTFITAGNVARPFLIDIDNDGDLDLVLGTFTGRIILYRNIGTNESFNFVREDSYFGNMDVGEYSAPFLIDYTKDGKLELFTGSDSIVSNNSGNIFYYRNEGTIQQPVWTLVTGKFLNQSFGNTVVPFFVDIDNDGDLDLFVGNIKGGLYYFQNDEITRITDETQIELRNYIIAEAYPNPFNNNVKIIVDLPTAEEVTISIYNTLGEKVKGLFNGYMTAGKNYFNWDGKNLNNKYLSSGSYFIFIRTKEHNKTLKILYLK